MNGFLRRNGDDDYVIGYFEAADVPYLAGLANRYTVCDHYFASILSQTFPNRMFAHAATTDRQGNDQSFLSTLPTIWDRLSCAGISGYYYRQPPADFVTTIWGSSLGNRVNRTWDEFKDQARAGTLPAVSFVDPAFGSDYHPCFAITGVGSGDDFLMQSIEAVQSNQTAWDKTVIVVTFDEGGGFFDHILPPKVRAVAPAYIDQWDINGYVPLGFRVPTVIVSPWTDDARGRRTIDSRRFDHTSVLKLIEWRWTLCPLTARDADPAIENLVCALHL
jgi:phospholipase C